MIISFYSYKGGVGRTQLCANIAAYFYYQKGKRVLLWDWDFEAPGLHYFFNKEHKDINKKGTLELFEDYIVHMRMNANFNRKEKNNKEVKSSDLKFITDEENIIHLVSSGNKPGCLDLIGAGNYLDDFSFRASNFDWFEFYNMMDGVSYIELIKEHLQELNYDYILIDSRTGISDYSGICNIQLPDINVMVIAATLQNFEGCKTIIEKIENSEYLKIKNRKAKILPVLSRIDLSGPKYNEWAKRFAEYFSNLIQKLDKDLDKEFLSEVFEDVYYKDTFLPYTTAISAGENIFTRDSTITKTDYSRPFLNIAGLIENLNTKYGYIEFYKKIDEASWNEYAVRAERHGDNKKAAIAYNQIGVKQKETADQVRFFEKAIWHDPKYEEALKNLRDARASQVNYKKNTPQIPENYLAMTSTSQERPAPKPFKKYKLLIPIIVLLSLCFAGWLYFRPDKAIYTSTTKQIDSLKNAVAQLKKDNTSFFSSPTARGSNYFDSIRNMKKPVGLDISNRNQIYDLSKIKDYGISFMVIKATEGKTYQDPSYKINWVAAKKTKFIRGAYHYYALGTDPNLQADDYIKTVKLEDGDLPPILDLYAFEGSYKNANDLSIIKNLRIYLDRISVHYGAKPIVFITGAFAKYYLRNNDLSNCYLWSNQPNRRLNQPEATQGWENWTFWQFSTRETFDGIITESDKNKERYVDANQFNGVNQQLLDITLKSTSGRKAVMAADRFLTNTNKLFQVTAVDKNLIRYNNVTFPADSFKKIKFNWDVELINQCFDLLRTKTLYGKKFEDLFSLFKTQKYILPRGKNDIHIGDVAFYDFQENKGIQACGIVYNYDNNFVYAIESYDAKSHLKVRTTKRYIADVKAFARVP